VLVAVSLPIVFWGQDARGYAPMVCFATASVGLFALMLSGDRRRRVLAGYGVTLLASLYLGFVAILLVPAELLVLLWVTRRREVWRDLLAVLGMVGVACLPLLLLALGRGSSQLFWVPDPNLTVLKQAAVTLTSTGMPPNFHVRSSTTGALIGSGAVIVGALVAAVLALRGGGGGGGDGDRWPVALVSAWFVVPMAIGLGLSVAGEPVELARGSVLLIPAVALLLGWALLRAGLPRPVGWLLLAGLLAVRLIPLLPSYGATPENWKAAARFVIADADGRGGCVAFYPEDGRMAFDYYVDERAADRLLPVLPTEPWRLTRPFVERYVVPDAGRLGWIASHCPRLWLIASHDGQRRGPPVSRRNYARYERLLAYFTARYPISTRHLFGYAAVIRIVAFRRA
jgi:hypothetical protein